MTEESRQKHWLLWEYHTLQYIRIELSWEIFTCKSVCHRIVTVGTPNWFLTLKNYIIWTLVFTRIPSAMRYSCEVILSVCSLVQNCTALHNSSYMSVVNFTNSLDCYLYMICKAKSHRTLKTTKWYCHFIFRKSLQK